MATTADLTLKVHVREHRDDGTPEPTWPNLKGAHVTYIAGSTKSTTGGLIPAETGDDGIAEVGGDAVEIVVQGPPGYESYRGVYNRPTVGSTAELPVSLRRL